MPVPCRETDERNGHCAREQFFISIQSLGGRVKYRRKKIEPGKIPRFELES